MTRILFILPGAPLVFNHSGAASRYAQNFLALHSLGYEVHVLRFHLPGRSQSTLAFENASEAAQKTKQSAASWQDVSLPIQARPSRVEFVRRMLFDPLAGEFPQAHSLSVFITKSIQSLCPQLVWAEHADSAAAVWAAAPNLPWVYSHHDMRYLIRANRAARRSLIDPFFAYFARRAEVRVIRAASAVLTGSQMELARLRQLECTSVASIPMVYQPFPTLDLAALPAEMRITHLGSLETTANRSGLISYLSKVHPNVPGSVLTIIGDAAQTKPPLSDLLRQPDVVCSGYIADLETVLRPFDVSILPYTQDSGYRTKLPLLMGYAQVILATRAAVAGSLLPGLEQVCILLDRIEDFPAKIAWLAANPSERKRLGLAARAFAERHFRVEAVRPLYADFIRQVAAPVFGKPAQGM